MSPMWQAGHRARSRGSAVLFGSGSLGSSAASGIVGGSGTGAASRAARHRAMWRGRLGVDDPLVTTGPDQPAPERPATTPVLESAIVHGLSVQVQALAAKHSAQ